MERLSSFLLLCLIGMLHISCLNADSGNTTSKETNHISADELIYEIKTPDTHTSQTPPRPNTPKKKEVVKLNNSTHQEMLVIYSHLEMSQDQILFFENQFNKEVKDSSQYTRTQIEIQDIMNASFETVLTEEQLGRYNDWRTIGAK